MPDIRYEESIKSDEIIISAFSDVMNEIVKDPSISTIKIDDIVKHIEQNGSITAILEIEPQDKDQEDNGRELLEEGQNVEKIISTKDTVITDNNISVLGYVKRSSRIKEKYDRKLAAELERASITEIEISEIVMPIISARSTRSTYSGDSDKEITSGLLSIAKDSRYKYFQVDINSIQPIYTFVSEGSAKSSRSTVPTDNFKKIVIENLSPNLSIGDAKVRDLFTSKSISSIVKLFHDNYIPTPSDSLDITGWEPVINKNEKLWIMDNIQINNQTCFSIISTTKRVSHRAGYANYDVYKSDCGICWLCGTPIYMYKIINKSKRKEIWLYKKLGCGEDEHCIPPILGNIIKTLASSNEETKTIVRSLRPDDPQRKLLELGVAPAHIICNQVKRQASFIMFPQNTGEVYTRNDASIEAFCQGMENAIATYKLYYNDPCKYKFSIMSARQINEFILGIKNAINAHIESIIDILNNAGANIYTSAFIATAAISCQFLYDLVKASSGGSRTRKKTDISISQSERSSILSTVAYLLIKYYIDNPQMKYQNEFKKICKIAEKNYIQKRESNKKRESKKNKSRLNRSKTQKIFTRKRGNLSPSTRLFSNTLLI